MAGVKPSSTYTGWEGIPVPSASVAPIRIGQDV